MFSRGALHRDIIVITVDFVLFYKKNIVSTHGEVIGVRKKYLDPLNLFFQRLIVDEAITIANGPINADVSVLGR